MEIRITYTGIKENGIKGIWCGFKPKDITVLKEESILYPEIGKKLKHKETGKIFSSFLLRDEITLNEFEEVDERLVNNDISE